MLGISDPPRYCCAACSVLAFSPLQCTKAVFTTLGIRLKNSAHAIAHGSKHVQFFRGHAFGFGWIIKGSVVAVDLARKETTRLVSVATYSNDGFHLPGQELCGGFGTMPGNIDANF